MGLKDDVAMTWGGKIEFFKMRSFLDGPLEVFHVSISLRFYFFTLFVEI